MASLGELYGKVVIVTGMRHVPKACRECSYYDNMYESIGAVNDGVCMARGVLYSTRNIRVSKERLDNCPLCVVGRMAQ